MTDLDQFLACAKLDGWILEPAGMDSFGAYYAAFHRHPDRQGEHRLPDYSARDAIVDLIKKQRGIGNAFEYRFTQCLCECIPGMDTRGDSHRSFPEMFTLVIATAAQLRKALLMATGNWK